MPLCLLMRGICDYALKPRQMEPVWKTMHRAGRLGCGLGIIQLLAVHLLCIITNTPNLLSHHPHSLITPPHLHSLRWPTVLEPNPIVFSLFLFSFDIFSKHYSMTTWQTQPCLNDVLKCHSSMTGDVVSFLIWPLIRSFSLDHNFGDPYSLTLDSFSWV